VARQLVETITDDVDGGVAEETISFTFEGIPYEIDLSKKNAKALRSDLGKWTQHARKTASTSRSRRASGGGRRSRSASNGSGVDSRAVRAWAAENDVTVPSRGRIPSAVLEQYQAQQAR